MTDYAIEITNLHKNYGKVTALRGVSLKVAAGTIFGFLGPNGSGKTTTIRCLLDLIRPQAGDIRINGIDPQKDPVAVQAITGYLPGELHFEGNQKVSDAFKYFGALRGNKLDWDYVHHLAERLDLDTSLLIKNLSKGNKQKVGLVQALMHQPQILLMDEPTSGLDPLMQQEVYRILREAHQAGATVFFSSHIINEVEAIAGRVAIIRQGVIVEEAEPEILGNMDLRRIRVRFKQSVTAEDLAAIPDVTAVERIRRDVWSFTVEGEIDGFIKALAGYSISDLDVERPSLGEIFLAYYQDQQEDGYVG